MVNKKIWLGMLGIVLAFSFVLTGCPDPNKEEPDTWTKVTAVNELAGTWKGNGTIPIPAESQPFGGEDGPVLSIPASSAGVEMTFSYTADAVNADTAMKIDMKNLFDVMAKAINDNPQAKAYILAILAFSGEEVTATTTVTRDHLWTMIMSPDAEKYYQTMEQTIDKDDILSEDEPVYINQNKTKLKFVLPKEAFGEIEVEKDVEFILVKQ
jgi:hypothetical protein